MDDVFGENELALSNDVFRHLAAEAALRALPLFDEDFIPFETEPHPELAGFIGLSIVRATIVAVVSSRFREMPELNHDRIAATFSFLNWLDNGPSKEILENALEAQYHTNPFLSLETILDGLGEFAPHHMIDLASKRNENIPKPKPDFFEAEENFILTDIHASGVEFFWQELEESSELADAWRFWRKWYSAFYSQPPLDWELQLRVAQIAETIWRTGPEAVAREIGRIEATWELEREVAALKERLVEARQLEALPSRLHNQPPEAIDDTIGIFHTDVTLVWDKLVDLEEEIEKPEPSPSRLRKIAKWLADKAATVAKYCGSVADEWLRAGGKAYAIAAGTAAGSATVAAISLPDGMKTVSELIEKLAALIGG